MDLRIVIFTAILFSIEYVCGGDPVMYIPPFEVRTVKGDQPVWLPISNPPVHHMTQPQPTFPLQQQLLFHPNPVTAQAVPSTLSPIQQTITTEKSQDVKNSNFTLEEFVQALNHLEHKEEHAQDHSRAAGRDYDYPPYSQYPRPPAYGYGKPPSYGPYPSPVYNEPAPTAIVPPTAVHASSTKSFVPDVKDIVKPVATKVASKISGLISLVLALLTASSPDGLEIKGFTDIVINGIVKPLLAAKKGIKSLIGKLTIPVISLLLINLEFLVTVWWLWEDCPEPPPTYSPPLYPYSKPIYNSYR